MIKRYENKLGRRWMFKFTKLWETLNGCVGIKFPFKKKTNSTSNLVFFF